MATVDDYYKDLAKRPEPNMDRLSNGQVKQAPQDLSPADGADGYVGSNTGSSLGTNVVEGKKGYTEDRPIWNEQSSFTDTQDNSGSTGNAFSNGGQDPTDEFAPYKKAQTDEGLLRTYRDSSGAGDAGPTGSDEGEPMMGQQDGGGKPNTQSVPSDSSGDHPLSDMPQTEFTSNDGGGAPLFKRSR